MAHRWRCMSLAAGLLLAGVAACSSPNLAQAEDGTRSETVASCAPEVLTERSADGLMQERICVKSGAKTHKFTVEIAASPQQQAKGLMFRTALAPDAGMIFPFVPPRPASFWMKNTYIPLDIIFYLPDGAIESIAAMAEPTTLDPRRSQGMVAGVLEIPGGRAAELGLKPGDVILRPTSKLQ